MAGGRGGARRGWPARLAYCICANHMAVDRSARFQVARTATPKGSSYETAGIAWPAQVFDASWSPSQSVSLTVS